MNNKEVLLGKLCKDKITGFEGICTGVCKWMYGCYQYALTPKAIDNKAFDNQWFDEGRIEVIASGIEPEEVSADLNGGIHDKSCYPSNNRM